MIGSPERIRNSQFSIGKIAGDDDAAPLATCEAVPQLFETRDVKVRRLAGDRLDHVADDVETPIPNGVDTPNTATPTGAKAPAAISTR